MVGISFELSLTRSARLACRVTTHALVREEVQRNVAQFSLPTPDKIGGSARPFWGIFGRSARTMKS